jgi:tetratricopeptide (TPR) repeat protein
LNPAGLAGKAQVALAGHRFIETRDLARQLATLLPGKTLPLQLLGDASLEIGDLDDAAKAYDDLTELAGSTVGTESRAARLAWVRGKLDDARKHLEDALSMAREENDPETLVWALVQRGEYAFRRGTLEEAEVHYARP